MGFRNNVFLIIVSLISCDGRSYSNYSLYVGTPTNNEELEFYKNIQIDYDVIYWMEPGGLNKEVEFMVAPEHREDLIAETKEKYIIITLIMRDVQSAFDKQVVRPYTRANMDTFGWTSFYRLGAIYEWLQDLQRANPNIMKIEKIGVTGESRPIYAVKLKQSTNETLPKVVIEGGIHAREWISTAFVTYLINELVHAPTSETTDLKKIALNYEWLLIPVLNPDGYEYSHTTDRMWRKNRRNGHGVDINRNFGIEFGSVGVENELNSESYCGSHEFSEPEAKALRKFLQANKNNLQYYLGFHAFGQYFIIPYTYTSVHLENYEQVYLMARRAMATLRQRHGTRYSVGTAASTVGYVVSGASTCWAKRDLNIPYVGTMELRDKGAFGFALPPEQILPTCVETMDAMVSFLTVPEQTKRKSPKDDFSDDYGSNRGRSMSPDFFIVIIIFI